MSICRYNYVGNYVIPGFDSELPGWVYSAGSKYFRGYYAGNYFNGEIPEDQWTLVKFGDDWTDSEITAYQQTEPFSSGRIETERAGDAYNSVLTLAGCSMVRDVVDKRIVAGVQNGTGKIINHVDEVGGWPEYKTYGATPDTDGDGMPDEWEEQQGLDPGDPVDRNGDADKDGYSNLEEYLNGLVSG
jgi:pectate lyase